MPRKQTVLTEAERKRRIKATAQEIGADEDEGAFDRAFKKVIGTKPPQKSPRDIK